MHQQLFNRANTATFFFFVISIEDKCHSCYAQERRSSLGNTCEELTTGLAVQFPCSPKKSAHVGMWKPMKPWIFVWSWTLKSTLATYLTFLIQCFSLQKDNIDLLHEETASARELGPARLSRPLVSSVHQLIKNTKLMEMEHLKK